MGWVYANLGSKRFSDPTNPEAEELLAAAFTGFAPLSFAMVFEWAIEGVVGLSTMTWRGLALPPSTAKVSGFMPTI
jgi:hypothetical protein